MNPCSSAGTRLQFRLGSMCHWVLPFCVLLLAACTQKTAVSAAASPDAGGSAATAPDTTQTLPDSGPLPHFDGAAAMQYVRDVVAFGPRWVGSPGHEKLEAFLRSKLKSDNLEEDSFTTQTPVGDLAMRNFIAKFPGARDGIIVVAGHYDTLYNRPDFVGANDAGSSTGLLLQLAHNLRAQMKDGKREGYSVWLVWLDGEEAFKKWTYNEDSVYGSRHLAAKWQAAGTLKQVKAFLLVDMVGDADLNIDRDASSTPWL